jgi:hypothetical protein
MTIGWKSNLDGIEEGLLEGAVAARIKLRELNRIVASGGADAMAAFDNFEIPTSCTAPVAQLQTLGAAVTNLFKQAQAVQTGTVGAATWQFSGAFLTWLIQNGPAIIALVEEIIALFNATPTKPSGLGAAVAGLLLCAALCLAATSASAGPLADRFRDQHPAISARTRVLPHLFVYWKHAHVAPQILAAPGPGPYHGDRGNGGSHGGWGQYVQPFIQNFVQPYYQSQPSPTIYPWPVVNPATGGLWGYTPYNPLSPVLPRLSAAMGERSRPLAMLSVFARGRHRYHYPQPTPAPWPAPAPTPTPTPTPPVPPSPQPLPQPTGVASGLAFVCDYKVLTPQQAQLMQALALRQYCVAHGIKLRTLYAVQAADKSTPAADVARIQAAQLLGLPCCWIEGIEVGQPLPASVLAIEAMLVPLPPTPAVKASPCPTCPKCPGGCPTCPLRSTFPLRSTLWWLWLLPMGIVYPISNGRVLSLHRREHPAGHEKSPLKRVADSSFLISRAQWPALIASQQAADGPGDNSVILNQGQTSDCWDFSLCGAMQDVRMLGGYPPRSLSTAFLVSLLMQGDTSQGLDLPTALAAVEKYGIPDSAFWPNTLLLGNMAAAPAGWQANAASNRIVPDGGGYAVIDFPSGQIFDYLGSALLRGMVCPFGISWDGPGQGGHALRARRLLCFGGVFGVLFPNTWGTQEQGTLPDGTTCPPGYDYRSESQMYDMDGQYGYGAYAIGAVADA